MNDVRSGARAMKVDTAGWPAVRTFMAMPGMLAGVSMTCRSILTAAATSGVNIDLFTSYLDGDMPEGLTVHATMPPILNLLPYGASKHFVRPRLRRLFLDAVRDGDIAYLWPSTPLDIFEALAKREVTVVAEVVNTRMEVAKAVLDAAYDALGLTPGHGITEARIADQYARLALCAAIFAPSRAVERSMAGTPLEDRVVPAGYGTWVPRSLPPRQPKRAGEPVTFLFLGRFCVRKGAHLLLEAWKQAPKDARLRVVGEIEPALRTRFAEVFDFPNVHCAGFTHDVGAELCRADVALMPSIEEGDPIATYEAAAHGVPVIASEVGAGRIGSETGAISIVDTADTAAFRARLAEFARSEDLRRHWGGLARTAALNYDWSIVAPLRMQRLFAFLGY